MSGVIYTMQLTSSQKMAFVDALLELIRTPGTIQKFVDCSKSPAVETSVTDLLKLVTEAKATGPVTVREWGKRETRQ
jgi:hypothetical protein